MDSGGNASACRSNWPSCCTEWGGDGERDPDERQTEVFRQLERPDGVRRPVVGDRRHQCDGVADKQSPPCPALTAAEAVTTMVLPRRPNKTLYTPYIRYSNVMYPAISGEAPASSDQDPPE